MKADSIARNRLAARLDAAVREHGEPLSAPLFVVDVDAFDANAADLVKRAAGKPIRVASKSVRVPDLLRRALSHDGFRGVLAYTLAEALWLEEQDVSDDVLVAYPTVDTAALARLVASPRAASRITLMIDDVVHLDAVDALRASTAVPIQVAIDIDAGLVVGGRHVGPKRSPLYDAPEVIALARAIESRPGFVLAGVMTYEGQVAGVPDAVPHQRAKSLVVRRLKDASVAQLRARRTAIADALRDVTQIGFWNAGGSGSLESSTADPVVTELTAGSGLLAPTLFDHYQSFEPRPAAFFGLPVTRRPSPEIATVHGGGLVASGPGTDDRLPTPWAPAGLHLTGLEGAGEVQTPLTGHPAALLRVGDLVWFRHAKSGEPYEHTPTVHLVSGERIVESVATYRGHGLAF